MSKQLPLFDALLNFTDPETSLMAAEQVVADNQVESQKNCLADALQNHQGLTSRELADRLNVDRYMVARRLPDLEKEHPPRARKGARRECSIGKRQAVTWWPVE